MKPSRQVCSIDADCNNGNGSCVSGKCDCESGYIGDKCQFRDPCLNAPCKNDGKCIPVPEDGSFYCDCKLGFIDPTCSNQDPCLQKGYGKCLNGSTCRRKNDFEFVCECQYPYIGTYCETYDLCLVDEDECVDDLNVEKPEDPLCAPCMPGAQCYQLSVREYACTCAAGVNDPSCHSSLLRERSALAVPPNATSRPPSYWNPVIPSIAISTCALYFIVVIIAGIFLRKLNRRRPRLIVCCDLNDFDEEAIYLISVETGKQFKAGTKANIYCFLRGDLGQCGVLTFYHKPFPLNDSNLREVHVMERFQEDNYLVSCPIDVGKIREVVIFYDDKYKLGDSWFCRRITIRNVKTDENWFFFVSGWINSKVFSKKAASAENVRNHEMGQMRSRHFFHRLTRSHIFIAPFRHPTPVRITLTFTAIMAYMFFLIVFLGFINEPDPDMNYTKIEDVVTVNMLEYGTLTAMIVSLLGSVYALFFLIYKWERIPTLIISRNKKEETPTPPAILGKEFQDASTQTDQEQTPPVPVPRKRRSVPQRKELGHIFRIPSTDIVKTEAWVSNAEDDQDYLVHDYISQVKVDQPHPLTDKIINYGLIGSLRDNRQQNQNSFVYQTDSVRRLESAIEKDIVAAYEDLPWGTGALSAPSSAVNVAPSHDNFAKDIISDQDIVAETHTGDDPIVHTISPRSVEFSNETPRTTLAEDGNEPLLRLSDTTANDSSNFAKGDFFRGKDKEKQVTAQEAKRPPGLNWELCEMGEYKCGKLLTKFLVAVGWFVCIGTIIVATVICIIYGGRYGYDRTYTWGVSLGICLIENLLFFQLIKVLILVAVFSFLVSFKIIPSYEAKRIHDRFQVRYLQDQSEPLEKFPLKYVKYLPQYWQPIRASVDLSDIEDKSAKKDSYISNADAISTQTRPSE